MPKTKVTDNIEFAYHDSGLPSSKDDDYYTFVLIHGHTHHSGSFSPMLEQASSLGYRMILPNRRLYPGSTPYTKEEVQAFEPSNSTEEITKAFLKQGEYLLLFVNNMIKEHSLKKVVVGGWSLGTSFISSMIYAITTVPEEVKARLVQTIKAIVLWEQRGQALADWIVQYYPHPNIEKKDCYTLIYKQYPLAEMLSKVDLTAGPNGDNHVADKHFQPVHGNIRKLGLFNPSIREAWASTSFNIIYGEESVYSVVWAAWQLEAEAEKTGLPLTVKGMPSANHFAMHDLPELCFQTLHACL
ncbi:hypothetical protein CPB84DRAFT_1767269 [Gymnopilus junonius]|uniref:AB hydrolase-1 domain-containing protein n=1 Tax=Gymnopilus junonius TaxID=109634 RepID=A0A9P5NWY1_GYMJU|nr:hypothetical protein CPB84DRAFT_1767269 [Gymnopilus junonius]